MALYNYPFYDGTPSLYPDYYPLLPDVNESGSPPINDTGPPLFGPGEDLANSGTSPEVEVWKVAITLIICVIGLIGNLVVIFVVFALKEFKKSVTHWYVLQLAVADAIFLITLPFKASADLENNWYFPDWMCKAKETILYLNYYASILFLMIMSIDRYIAVCHAFSNRLNVLRKKRSAIIIAMVTWTLSLLLTIPEMLFTGKAGTMPNCDCRFTFPADYSAFCRNKANEAEFQECVKQISEVSANTERCLPRPEDDHDDFADYYAAQLDAIPNQADAGNFTGPELEPVNGEYFMSGGSGEPLDPHELELVGSESSYGDFPDITRLSACHYRGQSSGYVAFISFNFAVMFLLPFIVMTVCYGLIIHRLTTSRMSSRARNGEQKSGKQSKSERDRERITIMCAVLVTSFLVCWLPFHATHLAKIAGITGLQEDGCRHLSEATTLLAFLNSALNPYLYSFLGTKFKKRMSAAISASTKRSEASSTGGFPVIFRRKREGSSQGVTVNTRLPKSSSRLKTSSSEGRQSMNESKSENSRKLSQPEVSRASVPAP
ncbi:somatostatin receptor type 2-like isoform X1 [Clavelina lepadiformis]|uniref:somatostatin receptor type 2-like isoform X1 n=1 Tax=Clavelina lepadiformis TaxID=159417 RepID=UPI0040426F98